MTVFRKAKAVLTLVLCSSIAFGVAAKTADELNTSDRKTLLYVGIAPCNNGEVTTYPQAKGCGTQQIGYTIDDASAVPADDYIQVYAGNDTVNNKMVSKDPDHKGGSTESIGYLSKKPILHGKQIFTGDEPCNMGEATVSTRAKGCNAVPLGYALPLQ
ncbi:hypothetical protein [Pseudomonas sp. 460]|uniref:hypothetical protein n=1 Tax=Pseudomonas sp. 460 TaxID=2485142 RepID=UPI001052016D|nr:hypothetical protein [Pseudomonas sp. 460]